MKKLLWMPFDSAQGDEEPVMLSVVEALDSYGFTDYRSPLPAEKICPIWAGGDNRLLHIVGDQ